MRDLGRNVCLRCEVQLLAAVRGRGPRPSTPRSYSSNSSPRPRPARTATNSTRQQHEEPELPSDLLEAASRKRAAAVAMFRSILGDIAQPDGPVRPPPTPAPPAPSVPSIKPSGSSTRSVKLSPPSVPQAAQPAPVSAPAEAPERIEPAPMPESKETIVGQAVMETTEAPEKIETPEAQETLEVLEAAEEPENPQPISETRNAREETREEKEGINISPVGSSLEFFEDVAKLKQMMTVDHDYEAALAFFEEKLQPLMEAKAGIRELMKDEVARDFLSYLTRVKIANPDDPRLPSVSRITEVTFGLSNLYYVAWGKLILTLVQHITRQETTPDAFPTLQDYEAAMANRAILIRDLLQSWDVFIEHNPEFLKEVPRRNAAPTPDTKTLHKTVHGLETSLAVPYTQLFISLSPEKLQLNTSRYNISWAAYATYRMLTDRINSNYQTRDQASMFTKMMKNVLTRAKPPNDRDLEYNFAEYQDLLRYIRDLGEEDGNHIWYMRVRTPEAERRQHREGIHRRIGTALKRASLREVKAAWVDFWGPDKNPDEERIRVMSEDPTLFDYFIQAFMQLRQTELTNHVWESMHRVNIKPTIRTWSALIEGCSRARSKGALDKMWENLITAGVKLDTHIWTSRVAGLFKSGDAEGGIRALVDMERTWASREKNPLVAVKPSIEPVNAAISGLLKANRQKDVMTVLAWAGKQGINPDIHTFNILLRPLVLKMDIPGIRRLLSQMQDAGIEADAATFTILFEGTMRNYADRPKGEQLAHVRKFITEMEASGIRANMMIYAKIIKLLVDQGEEGKETLKAVYGQILQSGLEPTPHIYTMLAEHFFSQNPPNSKAVADLIKNRRLHGPKANVDRVFWERVISGFCQAGEVEKAKEVFRKEFEGEKEVGMTFGMLCDYLVGLLNSGDREGARRLVRRAREVREDLVVVDGVKDGKGGMRLESVRPGAGMGREEGKLVMTARWWRHRFWHIAERAGVMN
ncbi:uncharacterized protein QC763_709910 [Podospora pseudopauciseta]|uniref:Pentatricopeptide repeat-containing protein n=1 Tax=Podospora pseudopauciseta TaxID=2093780 RepID=A0ABR0H1Y2_9PEZI|nr:hypothetical protein QC763_709910 [Podospora pseudopauciseta]